MKIGKYYAIKYKGVDLFGEAGKEKIIYGIVTMIVLKPNKKSVKIMYYGSNTQKYINAKKIIDFREIEDPWNENVTKEPLLEN